MTGRSSALARRSKACADFSGSLRRQTRAKFPLPIFEVVEVRRPAGSGQVLAGEADKCSGKIRQSRRAGLVRQNARVEVDCERLVFAYRVEGETWCWQSTSTRRCTGFPLGIATGAVNASACTLSGKADITPKYFPNDSSRETWK